MTAPPDLQAELAAAEDVLRERWAAMQQSRTTFVYVPNSSPETMLYDGTPPAGTTEWHMRRVVEADERVKELRRKLGVPG